MPVIEPPHLPDLIGRWMARLGLSTHTAGTKLFGNAHSLRGIIHGNMGVSPQAFHKLVDGFGIARSQDAVRLWLASYVCFKLPHGVGAKLLARAGWGFPEREEQAPPPTPPGELGMAVDSAGELCANRADEAIWPQLARSERAGLFRLRVLRALRDCEAPPVRLADVASKLQVIRESCRSALQALEEAGFVKSHRRKERVSPSGLGAHEAVVIYWSLTEKAEELLDAAPRLS